MYERHIPASTVLGKKPGNVDDHLLYKTHMATQLCLAKPKVHNVDTGGSLRKSRKRRAAVQDILVAAWKINIFNFSQRVRLDYRIFEEGIIFPMTPLV